MRVEMWSNSQVCRRQPEPEGASAPISLRPILGDYVKSPANAAYGPLPSKTLRETALYLSGLRQRGLHGRQLNLSRAVSVKDLLQRLEVVMTPERERLSANLERHHVECFEGSARFVDPHVIAIEGPGGERRLRAEHVLIATGSAPNRPAQFPFEHAHVYDSDEIVRVEELPRSMAIVGGGVIGCEYACIFAALGAKVTIIESKSRPMGFLDEEIASLLMARMEALGVRFVLSNDVASCQTSQGAVGLTLTDGQRLEADCVLVCAGRQANTATLNLEAAGLAAGKRGRVSVDASFRTSVPHIAAVGDVIGFPAVASTAMEQAQVAVVHMLDLKYKTQVAPVFPYGVFTIPEVSMAGETEASLREQKVDYVKGLSSFAHNARGRIIGEDGALKLLFRKADMKLLGVHCIGEGATELVHVGMMALMTGATGDLFITACFNYPTLGEAYKYATYDALGRRAKEA